jgi:hypothetical protein
MKPLHIITILYTVLGITSFPQQTTAQGTTLNLETTDYRNNTILLGKSTRERLQQQPFGSWFNANYAAYTIDTAQANVLKPLLKGRHFLIFMGTWCGDSQREVPRLYKLLDYCGVPASQIELVNVNNNDTAYKQSPGHEEQGLAIHRVPDLLIYTGDKETGRIVESPVVSWEKDLAAILTGTAYEPRYKGVLYLAQLFQQSSVAAMLPQKQQVAAQLKNKVENRYELNTYGHVLLSAKETEKAILTFQLNALLFPNDTEVWNSLAEAWTQKPPHQ